MPAIAQKASPRQEGRRQSPGGGATEGFDTGPSPPHQKGGKKPHGHPRHHQGRQIADAVGNGVKGRGDHDSCDGQGEAQTSSRLRAGALGEHDGEARKITAPWITPGRMAPSVR